MAISMTGYGRGARATSEYIITIDIKSINHRYLELYFKIPKPYSFLEDKLRREVSSRISRGKIEIVITIEKHLPDEIKLELNKPLVASYLQAMQDIKAEFQLTGSIDLQTIATLPEVFKTIQPEENQEKLIELTGQAMNDALTSLMAMRQLEGNGLVNDLNIKLVFLEEQRVSLLKLAPGVVTSYFEKLTKRIQELAAGIEIDPNRLAAEVAIFADKSDISEELVRLDSHLKQFLRTLASNEPIGRRLDFLIQELNREINTVGSKANDLKISQIVIDFKAELEKIREQTQNIE